MAETARPTVAQLRARIAELENENARLTAATADEERPPASRGGRWQAAVSALCLVLAGVVTTVSIVGAWVRVELVDQDRFVGTFAPLVEEPAVQAVVVDRASDAIVEGIDLDTLVGSVFDGLASLDLPPAAVTGLGALRGPAVQGADALIRRTVASVVTSDAFAEVWAAALRASHRGMVASTTGGESGAIVIGDDGTVGLQLAPIIAEVKTQLIDRGFGFASAIPEIDRTLELAQSDALATFRVVYGVAVTTGFWLPFVALALFAAGILVARSRRVALAGAGVALAVGAGVVALALVVGAAVVAASAVGLGIPSNALAVTYERVVGDLRQTAVVLALVGVFALVLCLALGPSRAATAIRSATGAATAATRRALTSRGLDTGRVGVWFDRQRVLVRVIIVAGAVVWLLAIRPLGVGEVVGVTLVALLAWWLSELVRRPASAAPPAASAAPVEERAAPAVE